MTANYEILLDGERVATLAVDLAHAGSPILLNGELTPFQAADAHHMPRLAAELVMEWCFASGGALCEYDEDERPVGEVTVKECEAVEV